MKREGKKKKRNGRRLVIDRGREKRWRDWKEKVNKQKRLKKFIFTLDKI